MERLEDTWKDFEASGRINDYLNYREQLTVTNSRFLDSEQMAVFCDRPDKNRGMNKVWDKTLF